MRTINWNTNPWDLTESESSAPAPLSGAPNRPLSDRAKQILAKPASQRTDAEKQQLMRELRGNDTSISGSRLQESRIASSPKSQRNSFSPQEMDMLLGVVNKAQDITAEMLKGIREGNFHITETALQQVAESNRASMQLTQAVLTQQQPQFVPIQRANFAQPYPRQRNWLRNEWEGDRNGDNQPADPILPLPCNFIQYRQISKDRKTLGNDTAFYDWIHHVGYPLLKIATENKPYGISFTGGFIAVAHAFGERGSTPFGRYLGYETNNWWGLNPLSEKKEVRDNLENSGFAKYITLEEGFDSYLLRFVPEGHKYENENVKIWEKWGELLKGDSLPTSGDDIMDRLRVDKVGQYPYCIKRPTYGIEVLKNIQRVKEYFLKYFAMRLDCIDARRQALPKNNLFEKHLAEGKLDDEEQEIKKYIEKVKKL